MVVFLILKTKINKIKENTCIVRYKNENTKFIKYIR